MALKRRATLRGRGRPRKRARRALPMIPRAPRWKMGPSIAVKRTFYGGNWTFGTAAVSDFWRYFAYSMTSFNNFAEFANVFDEYKVNGMKVTFRPSYDSIDLPNAAGSVTQPQAYGHIIVDPASTVIPSGIYNSTNLNAFLENDKVRTVTLNKPFSVYQKPKVLGQVAATGTAATILRSPWIRTTETGATFRGFHMFLQQNNMAATNTNISLDVFITFYVTFRNLK